MKILMLTPYLPYPPASGGQIRTFNLLKYLNEKNDITLVSLYKTEKEKQFVDYLKPYCSKIYACKRADSPWQFRIIMNTVFSSKPLLVVRNFSLEAEAVLKKLLREENFDAIHAETFYIMPHLPPTGIPILLVEQTIEYQVYQHFVNHLAWPLRFMLNIDVLKLKYWEKQYWRKASVVAAVSDIDQNLIKNVSPRTNTVIVPNGAGDEMFVDKLNRKDLSRPVFLFQGNFSWLQNIEAVHYLVREIAPLLTKEIPKARIIIAGQDTRRINMPLSQNIELVEIDNRKSGMVKDLYRQASLFICPIFGPGGTRLKLLAAMASGLPIISTKTGVEGLAVKDGEHVLIANQPRDFIRLSRTILEDSQLYERIRKNAFSLVKTKYSWPSISQQLEIIYQSLK